VRQEGSSLASGTEWTSVDETDRRRRACGGVAAAAMAEEAFGGFSPVQQVTDESTIDVLESIPLFATLLRAQLVQLAGALKRREVAQGESVVAEGETGDVMYIVESGALQASVASVGVVMTYGAGAFFGELALVNDEPRKATITATDASVLLELSRSDVSPVASSAQLKEGLEDIEKSYAAAVRTQIESIFRQMDLNADGSLDPMELNKRLSGLDIEEQYIENVFYSMDTCVPHQRSLTALPQSVLQTCANCTCQPETCAFLTSAVLWRDCVRSGTTMV
jgi:hypothetical protein